MKQVLLGVCLTLLLCVGLTWTNAVVATAPTISISPTSFIAPTLAPGDSYTQSFTIRRSDTTEVLQAKLSASLATAQWYTFSPSPIFELPAGQTYATFSAQVAVPASAQAGTHQGNLVVEFLPLVEATASSSILGSQIQIVQSPVAFKVSELLLRDASLSVNELDNALELHVSLENKGQLTALPESFELHVLDATGGTSATLVATPSTPIEAGQLHEYSFAFSESVPPGEHMVQLVVRQQGEVIGEDLLFYSLGEVARAQPAVVGALVAQMRQSNNTLFLSAQLVALLAAGFIGLSVYRRARHHRTSAAYIHKIELGMLMVASLGSLSISALRLQALSLETQTTQILAAAQNPVQPTIKGASIRHQEFEFSPQSVRQAQVRSDLIGEALILGEPNVAAPVLYTPRSGEILSVVESQDKWLKVLVPGAGGYGWIWLDTVTVNSGN